MTLARVPRVTGPVPSHPLTRWPDPVWGGWDGSPQADAARGFDARLAAGAPVNLPTKKAQALLAYLGLRLGQPHSRDTLAVPLWEERSDERARDGLRYALLALRKALHGVRRAGSRSA
jgi:two-component SAPR family response regulator